MYQMDEYILNGQKAPKKKKGKGILVIFFVLLFILISLCGAYWYYLNYLQETPKMLFFKYMGQNNFSNIFNTDIYYTMLEKMKEQSFETETTANFTTTIENEFTSNVDVSKLDFAVDISSDKENEAFLFDGKINYSSNDIFDLKLINTKDNIAIGSNEILDKYIATSKIEYANSIKRTTGMEANNPLDVEIGNRVNTFFENKLNLEEEYKSQKTKEYSELVFNLIPEEAVTTSENIVVTLDSKTFAAEAYTLSLDKENYKTILSNVFNNLKNDKELLNKIVTNTEKNDETISDEEENNVESDSINTINPLPNVQVEYTGAETENHQTSIELETSNDENFYIGEPPNQNLLKNENVAVEAKNDFGILANTDSDSTNETDVFEKLILAFVFNQKIEGTANELIEQIETELEEIDKLNEAIKITVYVRNEEGEKKETIKVVAELPNKINIDIEYISENEVKITCLQENEENITQGASIKIARDASDVKTKFDVQISNIENKKVVKKTQVELETEGSKASKDYTNEAIIKYNDSEGNVVKVNIVNTIKLNDVKLEETISDENAIFVDKLTDEEAAQLYMQVLMKIMQVYTEKVENFNFIDNNSSASVVEKPTININNEEEKAIIRQKLIDTVSNMMRQAQDNGTQLTIKDLSNLQIDDYTVSSIITEDLATIKINGYTFNIDKNFILTE